MKVNLKGPENDPKGFWAGSEGEMFGDRWQYDLLLVDALGSGDREEVVYYRGFEKEWLISWM